MIVRDEADQIEACLASLAGVVDRVEIVDTGSTDDTIRSQEPTVLRRRPPRGPTTSARNLALDRCRDARFALHVDADERDVPEDTTAFGRSLACTAGRALRIPIRNVVDGRVTPEFEAVSVFATDKTHGWVGFMNTRPTRTARR